MQLCISVLLFACKASKVDDADFKNIEETPGAIKIADNLYFDKAEVRNLDYCEYLSWLGSVYGESSAQYKAAYPDTSQWKRLNGDYGKLADVYLMHPVYRDYPVVGVSYEQALAFCSWRSDRVMQFILIREGVIRFKPVGPQYSPDSIFTIEKYFTGKYYRIQPEPHLLYYPSYSLPDSATYYKAAVFADSLNAENYKSCRKKFCADKLLTDCNCLENRTAGTEYHAGSRDPFLSETNCSFCKKPLITHLKGNVREMTNIKGVFYGSSFMDSCKTPSNTCRKDTDLVNVYTGFRNVCTFKKWKQ